MAFYDVAGNGGTTTLASAMTVGHDLTISSGTFTTSVTSYGLSVGRNLAIAGTLQLNGSAVSVGGDVTLCGTFMAGTSTVTLNGSSGQSLAGPSPMTFFNLVAGDPPGVTLAANVTVSNVLTLSAGSFTVGPNTLTISNPLAGTITNLVADGTSSITITGAGVGIVLPTSVVAAEQPHREQRERRGPPGGPDRARDAHPDRRPAQHRAIHAAHRPRRVRRPDRRAGQRLSAEARRRPGPVSALMFEIGDAVRYAPVRVTFGTVDDPRRAHREHDRRATTPSSPAPASPRRRDVNRFWTLIDAGIVFDTYDATFTFVAGDLDAGANTTMFIVAKLDGATWTLPSVGTRTALSTQALGLTSFSDFLLGQPAAADLGVTVSDGLASVRPATG